MEVKRQHTWPVRQVLQRHGSQWFAGMVVRELARSTVRKVLEDHGAGGDSSGTDERRSRAHISEAPSKPYHSMVECRHDDAGGKL